MTEAKPATDSMLLEARNVRVEEWPCDCPTWDQYGGHLSLCPVILIPALLARIDAAGDSSQTKAAAKRTEACKRKDGAPECQPASNNDTRYCYSCGKPVEVVNG